MSERDYSRYVSNRELLCKATAQDIDGHYEFVDLHKYLGIVQKIADEREEIQWLSKQKGTEASIKECENKILQYNIQLSKMESEYPLRYVIQRLREKEQVEPVEHMPSQPTNQVTQPKKKKSIVEALNKLYNEGVFTALTYIITFLWFGYLVKVVATADSHIIGKIFFIVWSLVLAFLFVIHKFGGNDDD